MDGADAVMLRRNCYRELSCTGDWEMTQIIKAVENSPLIQVPQNTPQIKNKTFHH
jgi:pyruvate kinase